MWQLMTRDFDKVRRQLARQIKAQRARHLLAQEALALGAGLDRTYVSQIERAIGNPSLRTLCRLADELQVDVVELLRDSKHP